MNFYIVCAWLRTLSDVALAWLLDACQCRHTVERFMQMTALFSERMTDEETTDAFSGYNPLAGFTNSLNDIMKHIRNTDLRTVYKYKLHVLYVIAHMDVIRHDVMNAHLVQALRGGQWIVVIAFISCGFTLSQEAFEEHSMVGMLAHTERMGRLPDTQDAASLRVSMQAVLSRIRYLNVSMRGRTSNASLMADGGAQHTMNDACALLESIVCVV
jgi:hypothetical protein